MCTFSNCTYRITLFSIKPFHFFWFSAVKCSYNCFCLTSSYWNNISFLKITKKTFVVSCPISKVYDSVTCVLFSTDPIFYQICYIFRTTVKRFVTFVKSSSKYCGLKEHISFRLLHSWQVVHFTSYSFDLSTSSNLRKTALTKFPRKFLSFLELIVGISEITFLYSSSDVNIT